MAAPLTALHGSVLFALALAAGTGCRAARHAGPAAVGTEAVLRYSGGVSGRPFGVRLWDAGREVRAATFGGPPLAPADTGARRSALRAPAALASTPPDTIPEESVGADGTRVLALCADGTSASVTVSSRAGVQAASDARCRRSPAEVQFRRAVDSVFTSLAVVRPRR